MKLAIGDKAPVFQLKNQDGILFDLNDYAGKHPMVIYFYPKNFTPGCVAEACSFRDQFEDFTDLGATVIGISGDSVNSHARFVKNIICRLPCWLMSIIRFAKCTMSKGISWDSSQGEKPLLLMHQELFKCVLIAF